MAARITEPAVGASTCASGSQVCTGHIGIFTAKELKKANHIYFDTLLIFLFRIFELCPLFLLTSKLLL